MSTERTIPTDSQYDAITFDLLVDGKLIDPSYQILSITVFKEVNRIPVARIRIRDGEAAEETFPISDSDDFTPGKEIQIKLGRDGKNTQVFKGLITKHSVKLNPNGDADLSIECRDAAVKMTLGRHSKYFVEQKDSEVIEALIGPYGLSNEVEATKLMHKELVQYHTSDWDFLLSRADVNGKLVIVDDGNVQVKAPDSSGEPPITLSFGGTLAEFEAEMDARTQWAKVKATAWDYKGQQVFEADASSSSFGEHGNISGKALSEAFSPKEYELRHGGHVLTEELKEWVDSCMLKSRLSKIRGRGKILVGYADVKPGSTVELAGVGDRFNGVAYVTAVKHEVAAGIWYTHIQFGLSPDWFASREEIIDFPAAGLLPAVHNIQIGKVVTLENDPDAEHRVQVKLPIVDASADGIWCRFARLDAGNKRGTFWLPEIGDEVIVGFINGDPRDPVVLGCLHSSANPAPIEAKDTNHEKGIFTRENMRIHFHDETKTITIDTPAGNSIILDEKSKSITITDQNKNSVTLDKQGITMDSPKDITIKAGASISIEAKASLTVKAASIKEEAQGPLEMKGALATMEASGIATVKGSLVKIN